uniref:Uncharacterized protein n=1 Tax=Parastrongyloides trichosuri TaxID=131310 RepID=A0A0N4ZAT6_PARTI
MKRRNLGSFENKSFDKKFKLTRGWLSFTYLIIYVSDHNKVQEGSVYVTQPCEDNEVETLNEPDKTQSLERNLSIIPQLARCSISPEKDSSNHSSTQETLKTSEHPGITFISAIAAEHGPKHLDFSSTINNSNTNENGLDNQVLIKSKIPTHSVLTNTINYNDPSNGISQIRDKILNFPNGPKEIVSSNDFTGENTDDVVEEMERRLFNQGNPSNDLKFMNEAFMKDDYPASQERRVDSSPGHSATDITFSFVTPKREPPLVNASPKWRECKAMKKTNALGLDKHIRKIEFSYFQRYISSRVRKNEQGNESSDEGRPKKSLAQFFNDINENRRRNVPDRRE